jgi:zinc/manganese transport system substrate-binding protein
VALGLLSALAPAAEPPPARRLKVVATLGVLGDFAGRLGGDLVEVDVLADPRQDPHFVQPRPTLNKRAREADLFVEVGLQLELWADHVVLGSGNTRIQRGQPGRCVASRGIGPLERPTELSRELGDVHPDGNPHMWLDPVYARAMAENIAESLKQVDPSHSEQFDANLAAFERRIDEALFGKELLEEVGSEKLIRLAKQGRLHGWLERRGLADSLGGWSLRGAPLRGVEIVTYHKNWSYLAARFEFTVPVEIEAKAGVPPSARHRDRVLELIEEHRIPLILQAGYYDDTAAKYLSEKSGARIVSEPIDCGEAVGRPDYFSLIDGILDGLLDALE